LHSTASSITEEWLIAGFMAAATLIIFAAVLHRQSATVPWLWKYAAALNFSWAQELCIYLFIRMASWRGLACAPESTSASTLVNAVRLSAAHAGDDRACSCVLHRGHCDHGRALVVRLRTGQISPDLIGRCGNLPVHPLGSSLMLWFRSLGAFPPVRRIAGACSTVDECGMNLTIQPSLRCSGTPISIALGRRSDFPHCFLLFDRTVDIISWLFTGLEVSRSWRCRSSSSGSFLTMAHCSRIIRFALALVGWMHGGLAMAAILACTFFATISGSSPATVVAIGSIMLPAMIKHGYPKRFSVGVITTSGSLGILIPPSIVMIIYAVSTSESAGKLFIAGIVPGILLAALLMLVTYVTARKKNFPHCRSVGARSGIPSGMRSGA
jgi:hypothetical protein